jgi:hypothetical protein
MFSYQKCPVQTWYNRGGALGNLGSPGELNLPYFHFFNSKNVIVSKTLNNNENIRPCLAVQKKQGLLFYF